MITGISTESKFLMGNRNNPLRIKNKKYNIRFNDKNEIEYFDELGEWTESFSPITDFVYFVDGVETNFFRLKK